MKDPFVLKDHFTLDPINKIYLLKRGDTDFFNAYMDYRQYLEYLAIIWNRINSESREIGVYHTKTLKALSEENLYEWKSLMTKQNRIQRILLCDFETFIIFSRRFMDKVARLNVLLIEIPKGKHPPESFTDHKTWFLKESQIHPEYSEFLLNKTHWYERDLLMYRDKVIGHGGTLTTGVSVSPYTGVGLLKTYGISPLQGQDKESFLQIKRHYENRYPGMNIPENDYEILNDFLREIRKREIRLDSPHLEKIGWIIKRSSIHVDTEYLESIARNIEEFLHVCASIFKAAR